MLELRHRADRGSKRGLRLDHRPFGVGHGSLLSLDAGLKRIESGGHGIDIALNGVDVGRGQSRFLLHLFSLFAQFIGSFGRGQGGGREDRENDTDEGERLREGEKARHGDSSHVRNERDQKVPALSRGATAGVRSGLRHPEARSLVRVVHPYLPADPVERAHDGERFGVRHHRALAMALPEASVHLRNLKVQAGGWKVEHLDVFTPLDP